MSIKIVLTKYVINVNLLSNKGVYMLKGIELLNFKNSQEKDVDQNHIISKIEKLNSLVGNNYSEAYSNLLREATSLQVEKLVILMDIEKWMKVSMELDPIKANYKKETLDLILNGKFTSFSNDYTTRFAKPLYDLFKNVDMLTIKLLRDLNIWQKKEIKILEAIEDFTMDMEHNNKPKGTKRFN